MLTQECITHYCANRIADAERHDQCFTATQALDIKKDSDEEEVHTLPSESWKPVLEATSEHACYKHLTGVKLPFEPVVGPTASSWKVSA